MNQTTANLHTWSEEAQIMNRQITNLIEEVKHLNARCIALEMFRIQQEVKAE